MIKRQEREIERCLRLLWDVLQRLFCGNMEDTRCSDPSRSGGPPSCWPAAQHPKPRLLRALPPRGSFEVEPMSLPVLLSRM